MSIQETTPAPELEFMPKHWVALIAVMPSLMVFAITAFGLDRASDDGWTWLQLGFALALGSAVVFVLNWRIWPMVLGTLLYIAAGYCMYSALTVLHQQELCRKDINCILASPDLL